MTQQLSELLLQFNEMSNEEQVNLIRQIRNNRNTEKPAAKKIVQEKAKPARNKARDALAGLTQQQLAELIAQLKAAK